MWGAECYRSWLHLVHLLLWRNRSAPAQGGVFRPGSPDRGDRIGSSGADRWGARHHPWEGGIPAQHRRPPAAEAARLRRQPIAATWWHTLAGYGGVGGRVG